MCDKIPDEIYILGSQPQPKVNKCIKKGNNWFCTGDEGGYWKLDGDKCKWFRCLTPFVKGENGEIDYSNYSDCVLTNYPYYITSIDNKCQVRDLTGNILTNCEGSNCCDENNTCDSLNCLQYKTSDRFLLNNTFNYKCDKGRCIQTESGKGDYTNPFCDYQCSQNYYRHNFACVDGICKQVSNPDNYPIDRLYDNPFCDGHCPSDKNISYKCNRENNTCELIKDKGGEYPNYTKCLSDCEFSRDTSNENNSSENIKKNRDFIIFGGILLFNILFIIGIFLVLSRKK